MEFISSIDLYLEMREQVLLLHQTIKSEFLDSLSNFNYFLNRLILFHEISLRKINIQYQKNNIVLVAIFSGE